MSTTFWFWAGYMNEMIVAPSRSWSASLIAPWKLGARTFSKILLSDQTVLLSVNVTPTFSYCESGNWASAPAPRSTRTRLKPFLSSKAAFWGVMATRRSFGYVSRTTPIVSSEYGILVTGGRNSGARVDSTVAYRAGRSCATLGRSCFRSCQLCAGR